MILRRRAAQSLQILLGGLTAAAVFAAIYLPVGFALPFLLVPALAGVWAARPATARSTWRSR